MTAEGSPKEVRTPPPESSPTPSPSSAGPVRTEAVAFLAALTGNASKSVTFQTFPEGGPSSIPAGHLSGTLDECWDELARRNEAGHGIFVMVNEGDGQGRSAKNVIGLRALFTDDDGGRPDRPTWTIDCAPGIEVITAHGRHTYWPLVPGESLSRFSWAQEAGAIHFGTDEAVKDLPRVMRIPGFFHQKDRSKPFLVRLGAARNVRYTIDEVLAAYPNGIAAANEAMKSKTSQAKRQGDGLDPVREMQVAPRMSALDRSLGMRRARAYVRKVPGAIQGEHGDDTTYRLGCVLVRDFSLEPETALSVLTEWNQTCVPPWSPTELGEKLERALRYGTAKFGAKLDQDPGDFAGTDEVCAVVPLDRYFLRNADGSLALGSPLSRDAAKRHLRSLGLSESVIKPALTLDLVPIVHGIDCSPGDDAIFSRDGRLIANAYKPPRITPVPGEWPCIKSIMAEVTDGDAEGEAWLFNWMAAKYQNPGTRSLTAPVFQGQQGKGKTLLGNVFAELLGPRNTASISQADLESQFNGHFANKLFVVADEVVNKDNLRDTASILKKYVTDPTIQTNTKNIPQYEVTNRMSWWFTSNENVPVKVEGPGDRRYTVYSCLGTPTPEYKAMLEAQFMRNGSFTPGFEQEMAAFANALSSHVVDAALARRPLENEARRTLIAASRDSMQSFLGEVAERGLDEVMADYWPSLLPSSWLLDGGVVLEDMYVAYGNYCDRTGVHRMKLQNLGTAIRRAFPAATVAKGTREKKRTKVYFGLPRTQV